MKNGFSAISVAVGAFLALMAAAVGQDEAFRANMWVAFAVLSIGSVFLLRRIQFASPGHPLPAAQSLFQPAANGISFRSLPCAA